MSWTLVSLDGTPPQPWRNGGGSTRELLAWPGPDDWRVRISVADVQASGPFSRFQGIERWFAVLEGDGVILRFRDGEHRLTHQGEPFRFRGDTPVDCTLVRDATRDFNLMAPPGRARLERVRSTATVHGRAGALLGLYTHEAEAQLRSGAATLILPPYHLAWTVALEALEGTVRSGDALWMEALG